MNYIAKTILPICLCYSITTAQQQEKPALLPCRDEIKDTQTIITKTAEFYMKIRNSLDSYTTFRKEFEYFNLEFVITKNLDLERANNASKIGIDVTMTLKKANDYSFPKPSN